jgi:hypothetical protein
MFGRGTSHIARSNENLLGAVSFDVLLGSVLGMLDGVDVVPVRQVCVMSGLLVISSFVMLGSFMMVACGMLVMLGCLRVMMGGFFRHILIPFK